MLKKSLMAILTTFIFLGIALLLITGATPACGHSGGRIAMNYENFKEYLDPQFEELLGALDHEEFQRLLESLKDEGLRDNLTGAHIVDEDIYVLIDGYNRYRALQELGQLHKLQGKITTIKFENRVAALQWMIRNQLGRRNLKTWQKCELGIRLHAGFAQIGTQRMSQGKDESSQPWRTYEAVANEVGVGVTTYKHYHWLSQYHKRSLTSIHTENESIDALYKRLKKVGKKRTKNTNDGASTGNQSSNGVPDQGLETTTPALQTGVESPQVPLASPPAGDAGEHNATTGSLPFIFVKDSAALWTHIHETGEAGSIVPVITDFEDRQLYFIVFDEVLSFDTQLLIEAEGDIYQQAAALYAEAKKQQ